jgi:hypothetical protein
MNIPFHFSDSTLELMEADVVCRVHFIFGLTFDNEVSVLNQYLKAIALDARKI